MSMNSLHGPKALPMELQGERLVSSSSKFCPAIRFPIWLISPHQNFELILHHCFRACPTIGERSKTEMIGDITPLYSTLLELSGAITGISLRSQDPPYRHRFQTPHILQPWYHLSWAWRESRCSADDSSTSETPVSIPKDRDLALSDCLLWLTKRYLHEIATNPVSSSATSEKPRRVSEKLPPGCARCWFHPMPKLHQTVETLFGVYLWWGRISPDPLPVSACQAVFV
jgi:hypothetical protein